MAEQSPFLEELYRVTKALSGLGIVAQEESEFSRIVEDRLREAGVAFTAEVSLSPKDRIDFVAGRIGIELKVQTSVAAMTRQLDRYAASEKIDWLVLVTASRKLGLSMPRELRGKGITTVILGAL